MIKISLINPPDHGRRHVVFWCSKQDDQSERSHLLRHLIRQRPEAVAHPLNFPGTCAEREAVEPHRPDDRIAQHISQAKPRRQALDVTAFETGLSRSQLSHQDPPGKESRITPLPLRPRASLAVRDRVIRRWAQHRSRASAERCPVPDRGPALGAHALQGHCAHIRSDSVTVKAWPSDCDPASDGSCCDGDVPYRSSS